MLTQSQLKVERDTLQEELTRLKASQLQATEASDAGELEKQVRSLKEALEAKKDSPHQDTPIQVNFTGNASEGTSTQSIAEQIKQQVEAARLETQKRLEENYQKRAENMRAQLSKKLSESKVQIRGDLEAEHDQAMQALKTQHREELDELQNQMTTLREQKGAQVGDPKTDVEDKFPENAKVTASEQEHTQVETSPPGAKWQPTEQEARALIQSHEVMRNIVKGSITSHVKKQNEILTTKLKEEHAKDMADSHAKAMTAKEHAVMMESKKTAVQLNMANNKANASQYKLELVEQAAQSTPDKAVKEVWDIAKVAKRPIPKQVPKPTGSTSDELAQSAQASGDKPQSKQDEGSRLAPAVFGKPTPNQQAQRSSSPTTKQQEENGQATGPANNHFQKPAPSNIPTKQQPSTGFPAANSSTMTTKAPQSALPVARGGANRGMQRGRGSGIARGGMASVDTRRAQHASQGRGSPTSGNLNPSARQFVPGNKRPREESQGPPQDTEGAGKRIKGGATST